MYINQSIINGFVAKSGPFKYQKLVSLLKELNSNHSAKNKYSCSTLIRAILDHVPPLLGFETLEDLVNRYPWSRSNRVVMNRLQDFRVEADKVLHDHISNKEDYFDMDDIPVSSRLNSLLEECLQKGGSHLPKETAPNKVGVKDPLIKFRLDETEGVKWANFAVSHIVWSCFRAVIEIDNYSNPSPDFVSVRLMAKGNDGDWRANNFCFQSPEPQGQKVNFPWRVEARDMVTIGVFISPEQFGDMTRKPMPDFDRDTLKLEISTRGGTITTIPIKPGFIRPG